MIPARLLNFELVRYIISEILRFSYFDVQAWNYLFTPILGGFWAYFPQMTSLIVLTPKRHLLAWKHVVWAIRRENPSSCSTCAFPRKKGQDRTGESKKSQRCYISPYWGVAPNQPICTKICVAVVVHGIITCAKFRTEIFRGYDFTGVASLAFLLIF